MDFTQPNPHRPALRAIVDFVALVLCVVAGGVLVRQMVRPPSAPPVARAPIPVPQQPLSIEGAPVLGAPGASVIMLIFSDFECPFCARFATLVFPAIRSKYIDTGRVQVAFRHLPLPIHTRAKHAAQVAVCANEQSKFWPLHDVFFASGRLPSTDLMDVAQGVGVDSARVSECLARAGSVVNRDLESAKTLNLHETPAFLIGRRQSDGRMKVQNVLLGALVFEEFDRVLEHAEKVGG